MKIKFKDSDECISLNVYLVDTYRVTVGYEDISENLSGFILYEDDEKTVIKDCSDFIYRWDIYYPTEGMIVYTNSEIDRQDDVDPNTGSMYESPIGIEDLISCVADLMFENSLMKEELEKMKAEQIPNLGSTGEGGANFGSI